MLPHSSFLLFLADSDVFLWIKGTSLILKKKKKKKKNIDFIIIIIIILKVLLLLLYTWSWYQSNVPPFKKKMVLESCFIFSNIYFSIKTKYRCNYNFIKLCWQLLS